MPAVLAPSYREAVLWQEQVPRTPLPLAPLPGSADVVVVGGGYCGLSAARTAALAGADVVLLEKEALGTGASARNGGMVIPELKASPAALARKHGDLGRRLYAEVDEAFDYLEQLAPDLDCDYARTGQLYLAHTPRHTPHMRELAAELPDVTFLTSDEVAQRTGSRAFDSAAFFERVGGLHPAKYHVGLTRLALDAGARVHDRTAALSIEPGFTVRTTRGDIRAGHVILATNAYADEAMPDLARRVVPINSYIIATEPLAADLQALIGPQMMVDTKNLLFYWRLTPDGRMAFGGRRSLDAADVATARDYLYGEMVRIHPQLAGVAIEFAWTGYVAMTLDRLPHVGTVGGAWYATGCNGTGVSLNGWLGMRLGEVVTGQAPPPAFAELPHAAVPLKALSASYLPLVGRFFMWQDSR
jgi:glycine/D-amino acid oxidase-like deaminating enzyme